jgi:pimeloyl-ACP methyl ester carboxylesterase
MTRIVLVHGAWHGPWCWEKVLGELRDREIDAVAVDLPFTGFADDVESARSAMAANGEPVIVIAHSYGGAVVSQAVSQLSNVVHVVFLAAFVNSGEASALIDRPLALLEAIVRDGDRCSFDPKFAQTIFYGDSAPDVVASIVPRLRPMILDATAMLATPSLPPAVPSTYVVCTRDGAIPPEAQFQMANQVDRVIEWPTDHSPFLTRPGDVADLLVERMQAGPA